ncbi:MAG: protein translocase subunit SecD [Planctomycetes bacterium]|nr:protein translocase subunit SecD [Planctomycetota bacterium]
MNRNPIWKPALIISLVVVAILTVYPLDQKLKPGIDLGGGSAMIYEIDTEGLDNKERKGIAQRMIPILRRRLDPKNLANIIMRPQGDRRIEIQVPLASKDTITKREVYVKALDSLEVGNENLMRLKRSLSDDTAIKNETIDNIAGNSQQRRQILEDWVTINDERNAKQRTRDELGGRMEATSDKITELNLSGDDLAANASRWYKLDPNSLAEEINFFAKDNKGAVELATDYVDMYAKWAPVINDLARAETGVNARHSTATQKLQELNLSIVQFTDVLELAETSTKRKELLDQFITGFPDREEKIKNTIAAFSEYRKVGGRLDDPEDIKRMLKGAGVLEFCILPTTGDGITRSGEIEAYLEALKTKGPKQASDSRYTWIEIEDSENFPRGYQNIGNLARGQFGEKSYVLASNQPTETMLRATGDKQWKLKRAYPDTDRNGRRAIGFNHDDVAAILFRKLTSSNIDRPLCIVLDDQAITAPTINSVIDYRGIITGNYTQIEVDDTVNKLNAGSFPARLSDVPISEKTIGSTIGEDNRKQGIQAGKYGMIAVGVFMIVYYFFAGIIAVLALSMNILFILAMMVMFDATFTLPGIAGLILTIGMSVDANVLIFERIREEQNRGGSLRTAIANGYQRAFRTIFDANITTFFVAMILNMVASEEIKGFAIVLMLGIASSMFTALFATRVIFDFLINMGAIKNKLKMMMLIKKPNINWMDLRTIFFTISTILVCGGITIFATRDETKNSKYGIEFTKGTSVIIEVHQASGLDIAQVRERIQKKGLELDSELANAKVYSVGTSGLQFEISTSETNKTFSTVTFSETGQTVETITAAINQAAKQTGSSLYQLAVTPETENKFVVSIGQVNTNLLRRVLNEAFAEKAEISNPQIDEIVSNAIRETFDGHLKKQDDLKANIVSAETVSDTELELADFLGGVKIVVELAVETSFDDINTRLKEIRFKRDMEQLTWYEYKILDDKLNEPDPKTRTKSFVYVAIHDDAGYRDLSDNEWTRFVENEKAKINGATSLETSLSRVTQIDPSIGAEAMIDALNAIILSLIVIVAYIWIRFGTANYGFAAIAALVHDVCIVLGAVTASYYIAGTTIGDMLLIQDFKIDLTIIAAFLTIIGYSLNDTIVVFDRIRENRGSQAKLSKPLLSASINQTLSRTLLTSFTTFMVVLVMYIWGGPGLRGFTFAMLVGIIAGTYSSIAIAAPILLIGQGKK